MRATSRACEGACIFFKKCRETFELTAPSSRRRLSATRKKRKPSPDAASVDEVKAFAQATVIPSVHTTKPPGVSALTLAKNGELFVSGGCAHQIYAVSGGRH